MICDLNEGFKKISNIVTLKHTPRIQVTGSNPMYPTFSKTLEQTMYSVQLFIINFFRWILRRHVFWN